MKKASLEQNLLQKQKPKSAYNSFFKLHPVKNQIKKYFLMQDPKIKHLLNLEGQCKITNLKFIRLHYLKAFFLLIPVIASIVGLWFLKHYKTFRVMIMYVIEQQASNASDVWIVGNHGEYQQIETLQKSANKITFEFKKLRYQVEQNNRAYPVGLRYWQKYNQFFNDQYLKKGLDTAQVSFLQTQYGDNIHEVEVPNYLWYMIDIMTQPFFLIQYLICVMFILEKITVFAIVLFASTFVTTSINYVLLYFSFLKIKEIAEHKVKITVIRNGKREETESDKLYPGDVIELEKNLNLPCDCILISGEAYINEASLTGQSVPVGKYKVQNQKQIYENNRWLFEGSKILDCRHDPKALVINTGYRSRRGAIIRKISNKVHVNPEMFKTAIYFLFETLFVAIVIYLVTLPILLKANIIPAFRVYRFFDFIGFGFPPTFPIYFNLAYSFSLYRLRKKQIFGTQPHKTIESAFLKTLCFDKTGTLTQNQLLVQKVYAFKDNRFDFFEADKFESHLKDPVVQKIFEIFSSCHSVKIIDGQPAGDQVDLRMFLATDQKIQVPQSKDIKFRVNGKKSLQILKVNQFQSKFQHMSVLVFNPQTNKYSLFVKGAPEKIHSFSVTKYSYFESLLKKVSLNGFRSIGLAYCQLSQDEAQQLIKSQIPRDIFNESNKKQFKMIGLVTFQNRLKQDTKQTIQKVQSSKIETKIITGDNLYIAIETANRAGILKKKLNQKVIVLEGKNQQNENEVEKMIQQRKFKGKILNFAVYAVNGLTERVLQNEEEIVLTQNDTYHNTQYPIAVDNEFLMLDPPPKLSHKIKIFARITPENKALIIKKIKQEMNQQYDQQNELYKLSVSRPKVGMVGDGANDLMALKQADVGYGISETDASYGSCFSIKKLSNIEQSIRDSKCTASIIVQCLRYYGSISFLKIVCSILMMTETTYFSATQLTYFNFASTVIMPIFITKGFPSELITPLKPIVNMLSVKNHLIYWGNIVIPSLSIICGFFYFKSRDDYISNPVQRLTSTGFFTLCQNTTVVFLLVQIPFALNAFFCYNNGPRFKEPIYKNYALFVLILINFVADLVYFFKTESLKGFLGLVPIPKDSAGVLVAITIGFCIVSLLYNYWVQTRRHQQKALMLQFPNQKIDFNINNNGNKVQNSNIQINTTQTFETSPNKQKTFASLHQVQFK